MMNYDTFLSRAAGEMQESAIRRMGTHPRAEARHHFVRPRLSGAETFPWAEFQEIAHELLSGSDGSVLQYGPTRGYRPLLEVIAGIMERRGVASSHRSAARDDRIAAGARSRRARAARSGRRRSGRAADLHRRDHRVPERRRRGWSACRRRPTASTSRRSTRSTPGWSARAAASALLYVVPNFQNPTGLLIGRRQAPRLLEWAARAQRAHRRGRSVSRAVLRGLRDGSGRPADEGGRCRTGASSI